jgi:putative DNA-invertase from lambdoid prophage Rac
VTTYAYVRVSTEEQHHGTDAQRTTISAVTTVDEWFEERASGKDMVGRPVFQELLDRVCDEEATLVVAKLDRLGRSVIDVLQVFERIKNCGASIKVLDMGIDTSTPIGQLMLTILAGFAEFERQMISQRTKDGLAAAREKGVQLGRPVQVNREAIANWLFLGTSIESTAQHFGCSVRTVQRIKSTMA